MKNAYVYRHRRKDNNQIFYVGIGNTLNYSRSRIKRGRNNLWKRISNKTDYYIEIIADNLTWKDACELEIFLISLYGRIDNKTGILCNMTIGGDGAIGTIISEERKLKVSERHKGKIISEETKRKISLANKGRKMSAERIEQIRESKKGFKHSAESKKRISKNNVRSKKVICSITGKIYNSIKEASDSLSMNSKTLASQLNGINKNKTTLKLINYGNSITSCI